MWKLELFDAIFVICLCAEGTPFLTARLACHLDSSCLPVPKSEDMLSQHSGITSLLGTGKQELSTWHASRAVRNSVPSAQRHITKIASTECWDSICISLNNHKILGWSWTCTWTHSSSLWFSMGAIIIFSDDMWKYLGHLRLSQWCSNITGC